MVYVPSMLPIVLKELGKAHFRVMMSQAGNVRRVVASAGIGLWDSRADLGWLPLGSDSLGGCVLLIGLLNCTIFVVFLQPQGGEVQCGWDSNESWNVMCLAIFLKPAELGELGRVIASMCN